MPQDPRALSQKAENALSSARSGWWLFGGREEKYEDAADLFTQAANAFRYQSQGREAGIMYERAAEVKKDKLNLADEAANILVDAYKAYGNEAPDDAIRVLQQAIQRYTESGGWRRAAPFQVKLAELLEKPSRQYQQEADFHQHKADEYEKLAKSEKGNLERDTELQADHQRKVLEATKQAREARRPAIEAYIFAASWYEVDGALVTASVQWLQVAELSALQGDLQKAIEVFEKVAKSSIGNMRFSVPEHLSKAAICHLASDDMVATTRALENYTLLDTSFGSLPEYRFLTELIWAYKQRDNVAFDQIMSDFNLRKTLSDWKLRMLNQINRGIERKEENNDEFN